MKILKLISFVFVAAFVVAGFSFFASKASAKDVATKIRVTLINASGERFDTKQASCKIEETWFAWETLFDYNTEGDKTFQLDDKKSVSYDVALNRKYESFTLDLAIHQKDLIFSTAYLDFHFDKSSKIVGERAHVDQCSYEIKGDEIIITLGKKKTESKL